MVPVPGMALISLTQYALLVHLSSPRPTSKSMLFSASFLKFSYHLVLDFWLNGFSFQAWLAFSKDPLSWGWTTHGAWPEL
ncbi:uncharacterized protein BKA55DRAFT_577253, partial [Fusarium redolens]